MPGLFNVENALAAIAVTSDMGVPYENIYNGLKKARASGRMEVYSDKNKEVVVIVDYAHNKMSFEKIFEILSNSSLILSIKHLDKIKLPFDYAEKLKRKINLSIDKDLGDYVVLYGDKQYNFPVKTCNEVVREVIDSIAADFENALSASHIRFPHNVSVSLTGGGLAYIRGGANYLARHIEMPVNVVSPKISYMSKPDDSSALSVLNYALNEKSY